MVKNKVLVYLALDPLNKNKEQVKNYQIDGKWYSVKIGEQVEVPIELAKIMVRAGDIASFREI